MADGGRGSAQETKRNAKRLAGSLLSVLAILMGVLGTVLALLGEGVSIAVDGTGLVLGLIGYVLGARRISTVAMIICIASIFLGLAASQGLLPGIEGFSRR